METFSDFKELKDKQNKIVDILSDKLNSFPKGDFGLIPDDIKSTDEFKTIKSQYNREFKTLQAINKDGMKRFKKEIRNEYEAKRQKRTI